jgi:hypothetical protein
MPIFILPLQDPPKIYPKWDFWFESIPSGNHGLPFVPKESANNAI